MAKNKGLTSLSLLKPYRFKVFFTPFLKLIECLCELVVPFLVAFIIDEALSNPSSQHYRDLNYILTLGGIMLALAVVGFSITMISQYFASRVSADFGYDLKKTIYHRIQVLSSSQLDEFGRGKTLNLLNNDSFSLQNGVQMFMRLLARAPFLVTGSIVASFLMNPIAGFVALGALLLCAAVIFFVFLKTPKQYAALQQQLDTLSVLGGDNISGTRVIRAFGKEEEEKKRFERESEKYRKLALGIARINAFINPLTFAFVNIGILLVLYFGSFHAEASGLTVGNIVALVSYMTQCLAAIVMFARLVTSLSKALASRKRIDSFFALVPEIQDGELAEEKEIPNGEELYRFENVSLSFGGATNALEGLDFSIHKGEKIGIIGGTGSGKSTILSLLERFLDVSQGTLYYKGHDIKDSKLANVRRDIALVSQKPQLYLGTVRSNLLIGKEDATEEEMNAALKDALAYEFVSAYEDGLDHEIKEGGANLSGGQRQRLLIARALLSARPVLILDDATSALDYRSDLLVRKNIAKRKELTTIYVSQRATSIKDCDQIYVLDNGKIVGRGKHEALLKQCPVYEEIYKTQVKRS